MKQPDPRLKRFTEKRELIIKLMKTFGISAKDIKITFFNQNKETKSNHNSNEL